MVKMRKQTKKDYELAGFLIVFAIILIMVVSICQSNGNTKAKTQYQQGVKEGFENTLFIIVNNTIEQTLLNKSVTICNADYCVKTNVSSLEKRGV